MKFSAKDIISKLPPFPDPAERYPPGSAEWSARITVRAYSALGQLWDYGAAQLVQVLEVALPHQPWLNFPEDHPLNHIDAYFEALCGLPWRGLIEVVRGIDPPAARKLEALLAENQATYRSQGTRTDLNEHVKNLKKLKPGATAAYLLRRIAREQPDILAAYERGDYPSARSAAIAAGIVKPPDQLKVLQRAWNAATEDQRAAFQAWLDAQP